jgi:hypothetical protein
MLNSLFGAVVVPLVLSAQSMDGGRNAGSSAPLLGTRMSEERTNNYRGLVTLLSTEARGTLLNGVLFIMDGPPLGQTVVLCAGDGMTVSLSLVTP